MKTAALFFCLLSLSEPASLAKAQEAVVPSMNADALFTSPDPKLNANKQAAYHIVKDLLEAGHWELADHWLTAEYHQHNPNAKSGRDGVVFYFTKVLKVAAKPIPQHMQTPVVAVAAEGDLVVVTYARQLTDPKSPTKFYTSTWFDMWRFINGKADEHWDASLKQ
jgi:predicted SnoaL-like aldol condensation-catalyzing enzyme